MKQIEVDYEIGQRVRIEVNGKIGGVKGIWIDKNSIINYNVEWATNDGAVDDRWFKTDEITAIDKESDLFLGEYEDDKKTEVKED